MHLRFTELGVGRFRRRKLPSWTRTLSYWYSLHPACDIYYNIKSNQLCGHGCVISTHECPTEVVVTKPSANKDIRSRKKYSSNPRAISTAPAEPAAAHSTTHTHTSLQPLGCATPQHKK